MHKHRETGKIVRVLNMDTDTTYQDEDGHSKTLDTAHFNSLYEETLETGSFGEGDISVAELLVEIDRMKQDHAATVDDLTGRLEQSGKIIESNNVRIDNMTNDLTNTHAELVATGEELTTARGVAMEQANRIAELEDKLTLANADLDTRTAVIVDKDKTIQAQTDQIAELTKPKETGKK